MNENQKDLLKNIAIAAALFGGGLALHKALSKKKVFISFDWEHDKQYRHLLKAWSENPKFDIQFEDVTPEEIQSNDIGRIKAAITQKIKEATHSLIIIGPKANTTHRKQSEIGFKNWICFETSKSKELGKKLIAVKVEKSFDAPEEVKNSGATWALAFTFEAIKKAIDEA